jgi:hypothetical protein
MFAFESDKQQCSCDWGDNMFTLDLSANVPLYGQQMCYWCGAASGQMARNGYPNPGDRLYYLQSDVWNTIQLHNSTAPADSGWATDPHGLTSCLMSLANPAGVDWVEFADASRDAVLHFMVYWMSQRKYPSPVLVNQGGHWVDVVGYETDIQPQPGNTVTLQQITVNDPEPHNIGTVSTFSASQWYNGPWNGAVIYAGTWQNQYVAVAEPPSVKGSVRVRVVERTGQRLILPEEALEYARRWIRELHLAEKPQHALLARPDLEALAPMVVRDHPLQDGQQDKGRESKPHYYIVPFGIRGETGGRERLARLSVLVNAYTGDFEEITTFGRPIRYLTREEALEAVATAMHGHRERLRDARATLMFQPSKISHIRAFPFWEIVAGERKFYIDQIGEIYGKLELSVPGD